MLVSFLTISMATGLSAAGNAQNPEIRTCFAIGVLSVASASGRLSHLSTCNGSTKHQRSRQFFCSWTKTGSWFFQLQRFDSNNIEWAGKGWGIRSGATAFRIFNCKALVWTILCRPGSGSTAALRWNWFFYPTDSALLPSFLIFPGSSGSLKLAMPWPVLHSCFPLSGRSAWCFSQGTWSNVLAAED